MASSVAGLHKAAEAIITARLGEERLDAREIAQLIVGADAAYAVQRLVSTRASATALGPAVGYKIGMSTTSAQQQYNITEPISGRIFRSRLLPSGSRLAVSPSRRIGVECEIAVRLGADLPAGQPFDEASVGAAVDSFHVGIEVLEDRFIESQGASIWALAADDMLGFGAVIGGPLEAFDPVGGHKGAVSINGAEQAAGNTLDLQGGGPIGCLAWLARRMAAEGTPLNAGDVVFCGGVTVPVWAAPDGSSESVIVASIDQTETVEFVIEWRE